MGHLLRAAFVLVLVSASACTSTSSDGTGARAAVIIVDNRGDATFNVYANGNVLGRVGPRSARRFSLNVGTVGNGEFIEFSGRRLDRFGNEGRGGISWGSGQPVEPGQTIRLTVPYT